VKLLVGVDFGFFQGFSLKNEGCLVLSPGFQMAVQAVVGNVQFPP
jgi:hypothetical protein